MTWTAPMTWVVGQVTTASQLNAQIRDNLNEIGWIQRGSGTLTFTSSAAATATITFPEPFNTIPHVICDAAPYTNNTPIVCSPYGTTASGCSVYAVIYSGASVTGSVGLVYAAFGS